MSRRQLVPEALRDELSEYSSLLRALRTNQTLDVSAHLTQSQGSELDIHLASLASLESIPSAPAQTPSGPSDRDLSPTQPVSASDSTRWKKRDQWTRWPLLAHDVPIPEWSLQDEVATLVKHILFQKRTINVSNQHDTQADDDEEDTYMQELPKLLTPVIENQLTSLFALLCAHTIARSDSLQNRIEPFDWHDLVNILSSPAAAHIVDQQILENVIERMNTIYEVTPASLSTNVPAPSSELALHRNQIAKASRMRLNKKLDKYTTSLIKQSIPPHGYKYLTLNKLRNQKQKSKRKLSQKNLGNTTKQQSKQVEVTADENSDWNPDESDKDEGE